ncbi:MAG: YbjN domain-containing protein [Parvularculaceae bacterium]|nr:YbjN domain-containing protein [Parvularculaceae bacterium]
MIRKTLAALAAGILMAAPAAEAQTLSSFTQSNVIEALAALGVQGARAESRDNGDGTTTQAVSFDAGGLKRVAIISACSAQTGCLGLYVLTIWSAEGSSYSRDAVNQLNLDWPFGKAFVGPSGTLIYARYIISDGGITSANFQANIGVYLSATGTFVELMQRQSNTVSFDEKDGVDATGAPISTAESALRPLVRPEDVNSLRRGKPARTGDVGLHGSH